MNPMRVFAVRSIASLGQPNDSAAALKKLRTAFRTVLAAADVDTSNIVPQPSASFSETKHHALIVWYDEPCEALRLFAPPLDLLDETTVMALDLLQGTVTMNLDSVPIEDADAVTRLMALMSVGGDDAADVHARFVRPRIHRYDEDFTPPSVEDLAELWGKIFPYYVGGTSAAPTELDVWFARVYAFGVGYVPPVTAAPRARKAAKSDRSRSAPSKRRSHSSAQRT